MRRTILAGAIVSCMCAAVPAQLTDETCAEIRSEVLPAAGDLLWRQIPWRDNYGDAVLEADRADEPVLLWAMNGHPLGCT